MATNALDRDGQVLVAPVDGRFFPIPATGVGAGAAQAAGAAMGQQHHRQARISRQGRRRDPIRRFLHGDRTKHGQGPRVEPEAAPGTGRPASHHRQARRIQAAQTPAAMAITFLSAPPSSIPIKSELR